MTFLGEDYLLETPAARELYEHVRDLPIADPHTHADVRAIVADEGWDDVWELEAATDHYVWAHMRDCGVDEELITGDASNREKWDALAAVVPEFAGNPTYEWLHLDLRRRFGVDERISAETADEVWDRVAAALERDAATQQPLLREMGVEVLGSTDDPADSLEYHRRAAEAVDGVDVRPTWRADRAFHVDEPGWTAFLEDLEDATDVGIDGFGSFLDALAASREHFAEHGCAATDLSLRQPVSRPVSRERAAEVFERRRAGHSLPERAVEDYQAFLLDWVGERNAERDWVTQLHLGAVRNYRRQLFDRLGPAAGGDVSTGAVAFVEPLEHFLNRFDGELDVVLYCLDPTHYPSLATLARVFPRVSVGPAWWFNDSPHGLAKQLEHVASVGLLSSHAGMVSDSRKLPSYGSRFEVFRRTLANVLGERVERGQVPADVARDLAEHVSYRRPRELYGF